MAIKTDFKMVANGHILEIYEYQKGVYSGYKGQGGRRTKEEEKSDREEEIRKYSSNKARNEVRRQVLANFSEHSKFVTLTFENDVRDVKQANGEFKKYILRMRRRYGKFKYLAVIEFTKKGRIHYHMISDLPYIKNAELRKIWGNGFVRINDIKHVDNVGAYMVKYMLKDISDERLKGCKAYNSSKGLDKPVTIRGNIAKKILEDYGIKEDTKKAFTNSYISEHHGEVVYSEYNLKRLTETTIDKDIIPQISAK